MDDGRKLEARKACGDGVGVCNQDVSLNNHNHMHEASPWDADEEPYTL